MVTSLKFMTINITKSHCVTNVTLLFTRVSFNCSFLVISVIFDNFLLLQARMKMDNSLLKSDRKARVNELLKELGLLKAQNTRIGVQNMEKSISGGERKRLAFASEVSNLLNPLNVSSFCF